MKKIFVMVIGDIDERYARAFATSEAAMDALRALHAEHGGELEDWGETGRLVSEDQCFDAEVYETSLEG